MFWPKAKVEKIEKLKGERDADDAGLKDIKNIVSKLNGIASVWSCVSELYVTVLPKHGWAVI